MFQIDLSVYLSITKFIPCDAFHVLYFLGSRKSVAQAMIVKALKRMSVEVADKLDPIHENSMSTSTPRCNTSTAETSGFFCSNETITMARLHSQLAENSGTYLNLMEEIERLFESLESSSRPDAKDRAAWLSLYSGSSWCSNTKRGRVELPVTRLNYTGRLCHVSSASSALKQTAEQSTHPCSRFLYINIQM